MTDKATGLKALLTKELIVIILISAAGGFAQELLSPVLPLYMRDVGLSDQNIGLTFSVMMVGIALSELFWGWAVDRVNLKIVLILGTVAYGLMILALRIPKTLLPFLVVMFLYGFSRSPLYIVGRWYMGVHAPENIKAQAFAVLMVQYSLTQSLGGFSSGFIVEALGFQNTIWIAAAVPLTTGFLIIAAGRWLHFRKPEPDQESMEDGESASTLGNARLITLYLGSFGVIIFISLGVLVAYLPLLASDVVHLAPSQIGILFGLRGIIMGVLTIPLGKLLDKVGKSVFIPIGMVVVAFSMFTVVISRDYTMLLISILLYAIGTGLYFPSVSAILAESVPVTRVGTAMGIYGLLEDVGWMIGPAVGGLLLNYWTIQSPFVFGGIMAFLGVPLFLWGRRKWPAIAKL
jgi:MFS family permease